MLYNAFQFFFKFFYCLIQMTVMYISTPSPIHRVETPRTASLSQQSISRTDSASNHSIHQRRAVKKICLMELRVYMAAVSVQLIYLIFVNN